MATLSIPNSFTNNTNADATQVNANFTAVATFANTEAIQRDGTVAFTAVPSGPATDPTTANQLTRKSYVDAAVAGVLTTGAVGTAALATNAVTTIKITDGNVTTAKILDSNVTTAKIADANVTTLKIADGNVTKAKFSTAAGEPAGAWVSQAITFSNITGGAGTCFIMLWGKTLHFRLEMTAGTVTANGNVTINLTGITFKTGATQPVSAYGLIFSVSQIAKANAAGGTSGIVVAATGAGATWTAADPVSGIKINGVVEID